jgi:uncharacterized protein with HEPN domain
MPSEKDLGVVVDIVAAARQTLRFVEGMDLNEFRDDPRTSSAVILQLLIIGEASKRLSDEFHEKHREIPWSDIVRMRDLLIHHYRRTDLRQVWSTVQTDLSPLLATLEPLVEPPPHAGDVSGRTAGAE